jgi:hypothetical protein
VDFPLLPDTFDIASITRKFPPISAVLFLNEFFTESMSNRGTSDPLDTSPISLHPAGASDLVEYFTVCADSLSPVQAPKNTQAAISDATDSDGLLKVT